jgi:hypothetical protein
MWMCSVRDENKGIRTGDNVLAKQRTVKCMSVLSCICEVHITSDFGAAVAYVLLSWMGERFFCLSYLMVNYHDLDEIYKNISYGTSLNGKEKYWLLTTCSELFKTIFVSNSSNFFWVELPILLQLLAVSKCETFLVIKGFCTRFKCNLSNL